MSELTTYGLIFAVYLAAMLAIGFWVYRRNQNLSDYVLGGRRLNYWVTALSAMASDLSAWLLLGLPGAAYASGLGAAWIPLGLFVGLYINWRVIAGRLRVYTECATDYHTGKEGDALTLSSYFENRFEDRSHILRLVSAIVIIIFFTVYVSSGLVAGGVVFHSVFDAPAILGIAITIGIVMVYTFVGGFLAVSYTDSVQAVLMWVAVIAVPIVTFALVGGFSGLIDGLEARNPALASFGGTVSFADGSWASAGAVSAVTIISGIAWGPGYFGQPHILARFMGIRSAAHLPKARRIGVTYGITGMGMSCIIGLVGIAYFAKPLSNPESVFLRLASGIFPTWIAGLFLVGVLAAIMSTASSQLLVVVSALAEDLYRRFVNRSASGKHLLWVGRGLVILVEIVACLIALKGGSVLSIVAYAWAGLGSAFGTVIFASLFWRNMNRVGAIAGMIGGGATVLIYKQIDTIGLYEMVPGVIVSVVCILIFNRLGKAPTPTMHSDFDLATARYKGREQAESAEAVR